MDTKIKLYNDRGLCPLYPRTCGGLLFFYNAAIYFILTDISEFRKLEIVFYQLRWW